MPDRLLARATGRLAAVVASLGARGAAANAQRALADRYARESSIEHRLEVIAHRRSRDVA